MMKTSQAEGFHSDGAVAQAVHLGSAKASIPLADLFSSGQLPAGYSEQVAERIRAAKAAEAGSAPASPMTAPQVKVDMLAIAEKYQEAKVAAGLARESRIAALVARGAQLPTDAGERKLVETGLQIISARGTITTGDGKLRFAETDMTDADMRAVQATLAHLGAEARQADYLASGIEIRLGAEHAAEALQRQVAQAQAASRKP